MIVDKTGDIFTSDAHVIGHGVNCVGVMGKGIAVAFKTQYPRMYNQYREKCENGRLKPGDVFVYCDPETGRLIANLASQDKPGPNARYEWAMQSIQKTLDWMPLAEVTSLAIPRIGCGIGGLNWDQMYYRLLDEFGEHPLTIEVWSQ